MPVCAKLEAVLAHPRRPIFRTVAGAIFLGATALALASDFQVSSVQARTVGQTLHVDGHLELGLTPRVEEAIDNGIPIELAIDIRLYRQRPLIWDERVATWTLRRELRYHALSGQYLIGGASAAPVDRENFDSLNEALTEMGALEAVMLPLNEPLESDTDYRVDVRVALDIEALPSLLRPLAYTSRAWDLNSGWTTWKVQR